jgi:4-hydroxy-tetrahydrodipicolinate reductase
MQTILSGACGRTGSLVARAIIASRDVELAGAVEAPGSPAVGHALCDVIQNCSSPVAVRPTLEDFDSECYDVIVDFSVPAQSVHCAETARLKHKGLVIGTTGLSEEQLRIVRTASSECAVVLASNMSVGANVLFALVRDAVAALGPDFDVEIVETHHRWKADAPSGTALTIADVVASERGLDAGGLIRSGRRGPSLREAGEIGVHSVRGGAVAGRHTVHFLSDTETLVLEHAALSRQAFAEGAVRAALFAGSSPPGLYDMCDVLGLSARPKAGPPRDGASEGAGREPEPREGGKT